MDAIKTDEDYQAAMREIERLWDAVPNTPGGDELEAWIALVEAYEDEHYPIPPPNLIEAIKYRIESRGGLRLAKAVFSIGGRRWII